MSIEKACENCGQPFVSFPSAKQRFCSLMCRSAFRFQKHGVAPGREIVHFTCRNCSKPFSMMQSYLSEYRRKHEHDPLYCSRPCSAEGRKRASDLKHAFTCANCDETFNKSRKPGGRLYNEQKYCSPKCRHEFIKKRALAKFEAGNYGRHIKRHGYVWISVPSLVTGKRHAVLEHRYVMSKHLGRDLRPDETVHHINGVRSENDLTNLELFSSRHGPGQRVTDKVTFAIEILSLYPDFARQAGYALHKIEHDSSDAALSLPG